MNLYTTKVRKVSEKNKKNSFIFFLQRTPSTFAEGRGTKSEREGGKGYLTFFRKRHKDKVYSLWFIINMLSPDDEKIVVIKIHIY